MLNQEERDFLDKYFTSEELGKAMSDLKPNKSPGSDGLTKEFYASSGRFCALYIWTA